MFPVEAFQTTLSKLTSILRAHEIRFHLTGGLTGSAYGEPRMTQDIDVVIDPDQTKGALDGLVQSVEESDFMFNEDSMRSAVASGDQFQLLDEFECLKLDIYPREMIPGELDRSVQMEIFEGEFLPVVSRVDAAASKLVRISKGSHKSRRDLRAMFRSSSHTQQTEIRTQAERRSMVGRSYVPRKVAARGYRCRRTDTSSVRLENQYGRTPRYRLAVLSPATTGSRQSGRVRACASPPSRPCPRRSP